MTVQLIGLLVVILAFGAAIAGAAYVFAMTAEREPERARRPETSRRSGTPTSVR
jgi:hypothetical protein